MITGELVGLGGARISLLVRYFSFDKKRRRLMKRLAWVGWLLDIEFTASHQS